MQKNDTAQQSAKNNRGTPINLANPYPQTLAVRNSQIPTTQTQHPTQKQNIPRTPIYSRTQTTHRPVNQELEGMDHAHSTETHSQTIPTAITNSTTATHLLLPYFIGPEGTVLTPKTTTMIYLIFASHQLIV